MPMLRPGRQARKHKILRIGIAAGFYYVMITTHGVVVCDAVADVKRPEAGANDPAAADPARCSASWVQEGIRYEHTSPRAELHRPVVLAGGCVERANGSSLTQSNGSSEAWSPLMLKKISVAKHLDPF